jgi:cytochrome oxidase Cu insertion factor (SCO1/SenC/PrrC family)
MKKFVLSFAVLALMAGAALAQGGTPAPTPPPMKFKVGDMAPDFALRDSSGKDVKLSDFRGKKNVVLAFYVLAFTGG